MQKEWKKRNFSEKKNKKRWWRLVPASYLRIYFTSTHFPTRRKKKSENKASLRHNEEKSERQPRISNHLKNVGNCDIHKQELCLFCLALFVVHFISLYLDYLWWMELYRNETKPNRTPPSSRFNSQPTFFNFYEWSLIRQSFFFHSMSIFEIKTKCKNENETRSKSLKTKFKEKLR